MPSLASNTHTHPRHNGCFYTVLRSSRPLTAHRPAGDTQHRNDPSCKPRSLPCYCTVTKPGLKPRTSRPRASPGLGQMRAQTSPRCCEQRPLEQPVPQRLGPAPGPRHGAPSSRLTGSRRLGSPAGPGPPSLDEAPAAPSGRTARRAAHTERRGPAPSAAIEPLPPARSSPRLAPPLPPAPANRVSASCGRASARPSANHRFCIGRKRGAGRGDVREGGTSAALRLDEAEGRGRGESLGRRRGAGPEEAGRGRAVRGASILAHKGAAAPRRGSCGAFGACGVRAGRLAGMEMSWVARSPAGGRGARCHAAGGAVLRAEARGWSSGGG